MTNTPDPSAEIPVVHPALSEKEWNEALSLPPGIAWGFGLATGGTVSRHAMAAICLYGTPEGFTQEDVDELLWNATMADPMTPVEWKIENGVRNAFAIAGRLRTLADRISALLPPKSHP